MFENDWDFGHTMVYCDGKNGKCKNELEIDGFDNKPLSWSDVSKEIKEHDWIIKKQNGEWVHLCTDCQE